MAVTITAYTSTTHPHAVPPDGYQDLLSAEDLDVSGDPYPATLSNITLGNGERDFELPGSIAVGFWSERIASQVTLSGSVSFEAFANVFETGLDLRLRARLFKITYGGSNVESLVLSADDTVAITMSGEVHSWSGTIPAAVTIAPNERLILRLTAFPETGDFGIANSPIFVWFNGGSIEPTKNVSVVLPDGITFKPNATNLFLRRTTTIGIGNFLDMLPARGVTTATTRLMDTIAGGTETQWTPLTIDSIAVSEVAAALASTANATTYASASFTPVANRLYLLAVVHSDTAPEATVPTVATTTGLAFVLVGSSLAFDTIASNVHRISLFRAMKASGLSAGTYTVTLADAGTGCAATLAEVTGVETTGADGANAVRNITTRVLDATADPATTSFVAGLLHSYTGVFACVGSDIATAPTPGSGFTGLTHRTYATPTTGVLAEWLALNGGVQVLFTLAASDYGLIAVELVPNTTQSTVLEWISPRLSRGWAADTATQFVVLFSVRESSLLANCALNAKISRRRPDGSETVIFTFTGTLELTAVLAFQPNVGGGTFDATEAFLDEDDRLVVRVYLAPAGTMAGGHLAELSFDHDSDAVGQSLIWIYDPPDFKAEGDPAGTSIVPSGGSMVGVSNGQ